VFAGQVLEQVRELESPSTRYPHSQDAPGLAMTLVNVPKEREQESASPEN